MLSKVFFSVQIGQPLFELRTKKNDLYIIVWSLLQCIVAFRGGAEILKANISKLLFRSSVWVLSKVLRYYRTEIMTKWYESELSTGRMDPRVGSGRVSNLDVLVFY